MKEERPDVASPMRRSVTALTATVPALIAGTACQADEDDSFRVTNVEFDNDSTIILTFSEPLAATDGIDPNDFRVSLGFTAEIKSVYDGMPMTEAYTYYNDAGYVAAGGYGGLQPFTLMSVAPGSSSNQMVLRTTWPLGPGGCEFVAQTVGYWAMYDDNYNGVRYDVGLFLHYASGDVPIEAESGRLLGDIAADWVRSQDFEFGRQSYGFTMHPLRIPCP